MATAAAADEDWAWWLAAGGVSAIGGLIVWQSFRSSHGPPKPESLEAVPPSAPVPVVRPASPLPPSGPKASSYPGARGPRHAVDTQLSPGPGYTIRSPSKAWGTAPTIAAIKGAAARWFSAAPAFFLDHVKIRIADISKRGGGHLSPHVSHDKGRDVDITLQGVPGEKLPAVALPLLLGVFLEDPAVQVIFLDWNRQEQVWWALEANPELNGAVLAELQFPKGRHSGRTRVRHWKGHRNHLHVRYRS